MLKPGGVFGTQSESPEAFRDIHIAMVRLLREVFDHADPLYGWVPMYPSGWWSWTFAAMATPRYRTPDPERSEAIAAGCEIWSCLLYTSPSPRDMRRSRMPSSA